MWVQESLQLLADHSDQPVDISWGSQAITWSKEEEDNDDETVPMELAPTEERIRTPSPVAEKNFSEVAQSDIPAVTVESETIVT